MHRLLYALSCALLVRAVHGQNNTRVCNNSPLLCGRQYDEVVQLGAHDSMFVRNSSNGYSIGGNQFFTSPVQLDGGVRLLTGQIHGLTDANTKENVWYLCHTLCQIYSAGTLSGWLTTVREWLDGHPNDVITILLVNSNNANGSALDGDFQASGMADYAYVPANRSQPTTEWPTLDEMIDLGKRAVIYIAGLDDPNDQGAPYLLNQFSFTFENQYEILDVADFSCDANRPDELNGLTAQAVDSGRLPIMNHFLYDDSSGFEIPAVRNVTFVNAPGNETGMLGAAADNCTRVYGKPPTYVLVDFANAGPALDTVDRLNGVGGAIQGRRALPSGIYTSGPGPTETAPLPVSTGGSGSSSSSSGGSSASSSASSGSGGSTSTTSSSSASSGSAASTATTTATTTTTALPTATTATTAPASSAALDRPNAASRPRPRLRLF